MATTDLKLDDPGTISRPGPIGRLVRLALGMASLWYVSSLIGVSRDLMSGDGGIQPLIWNGVPAGLFLVSYIINIGFSRAWKKWPAIFSAALLLVIAGIGYLVSGERGHRDGTPGTGLVGLGNLSLLPSGRGLPDFRSHWHTGV